MLIPVRRTIHLSSAINKTFNLYPLDNLDRKFKSEYIYFALESIYDCSITMRVEFTSETQVQGKDKDKEQEDEEGFDSPKYYSFSSPEKKTRQDDKIKSYIERMANWKKTTVKEFKVKKQMREERIKKTLERKDKIVEENIKKKIFYLQRWEYVHIFIFTKLKFFLLPIIYLGGGTHGLRKGRNC